MSGSEFTFIEALLLGVMYWFIWCEFKFYPIPMPGEIGYLGFYLGLGYGDIATGCIIGGSIGLINISNFAYGASIPADTGMAGCIAIPMAIKFGLTTGEALALAVPFGVLGALINNVRRAFAGVFWRQAQKDISERKYGRLKFYGIWEPMLMNIIWRLLPVTLLLYLFGTAGGNAVANMPAWLSHSFSMMGLMLPGVGLVLCISIMGNRSFLPYCVIGFFLLGRFGFKMVEVALMGIVLGFLHTLYTADDEDDEEEEEEEEHTDVKGIFSTGDLIWFNWYWYCFYRVSQCMEYFYGVGNAAMMYKNMRKIYKDDEEGLQKGMERCLEPWISHPLWGEWMLGAQFAMEEDIAANGDPTGDKGRAISAMKTGFMGPFAGIGDTISGSVLLPIIRSFSYSAFLTGSWTGIIPLWLLDTFNWVIGCFSVNIGYKAGINTILRIIDTPLFSRILTIAIVTGMVTMGALSASYVVVKTTLEFNSTVTDAEGNTGEVVMKLQDKFDQIMPNLLTLLYMALLITLQFKNTKTTTMMLITVVIAFIGAILHVW